MVPRRYGVLSSFRHGRSVLRRRRQNGRISRHSGAASGVSVARQRQPLAGGVAPAGSLVVLVVGGPSLLAGDDGSVCVDEPPWSSTPSSPRDPLLVVTVLGLVLASSLPVLVPVEQRASWGGLSWRHWS
jgi:hypothetical protein